MFEYLINSKLPSSTQKVLAILTKVWGSAPQQPGAKMLIWQNGFSGTLGGGRLELEVLNKARALLQNPETRTDVLEFVLSEELDQCCGGKVQVYLERDLVKHPVLCFGAGHIGQELASILAGTNIDLHVVDERPEWTTRLNPNTSTHTEGSLSFAEKLGVGFSEIALVMTHAHDLDEKLVDFLAQRPWIKKIGLIGSQTKWRRFKTRLENAGLSESMLSKVHCPVGVHKTSKHPREIAISIAAQVLEWVGSENA